MRLRILGLGLAALILSGCDSGGSAVETRPRDGDARSLSAVVDTAAETTNADSVAKPAVTANRRESSDAKIERLFARNGAAFGAKSADDYLTKVRRFTSEMPAGTEMIKRPNGDTLYYQASTNTFAVVDASGVPRTMFKPDDGPTYWAQQKERAPTFGQQRSSSSAE